MSDMLLRQTGLALVGRPRGPTTDPRDGVEGLIHLLGELAHTRGGQPASERVLDLLRLVPWEDQDPSVVRLLVDITRSYVDLADQHQHLSAEHRHSELLRRGLEHLATHDVLTGLPNRALVLDRLEHALAAARPGTTLVVLFVDVDGFKQINDTLGHAAGDAVLVEIARRLSRATRGGDTLGRLSGDEFVVVCEDLPGSASEVSTCLDVLADRFAEVLGHPGRADGPQVLSASIGATVATAPCATGAHDLLAEADAAMYLAKRAGGGRLVVSEPRRGVRPVPPSSEAEPAGPVRRAGDSPSAAPRQAPEGRTGR